MATWEELLVKQTLAAPAETQAYTINFENGEVASEGNRLVLIVAPASVATVSTPPGWTLDVSVTGWTHCYVFSRAVPAGGLSGVELNFSAPNRPVVRLMEFQGIGGLHRSATSSSAPSTGVIETTSHPDVLCIGVAFGVINGGEPTYDTWSEGFTSIGSLRSLAAAPYDIPLRVATGFSYLISDETGTFSSTATLGGSGGPAVLSPAGLMAAYQIGASVPVVDAGHDLRLPLSATVSVDAGEDNGGGNITARSWTVVSGPAGVGNVIGDTATLSWQPPQAGTYVIRYSATNSAGTGSDELQVIIEAPVVTVGSSSPINVSLAPGYYRSRIKAVGSASESGYSSWTTFIVPSGELDLPRIPWEGGSQYWEQFSKAHDAGWSDPGFFPITVFLGKPSHTPALMDVGINVLQGVEHDGSDISMVTNEGMHALLQSEWTQSEINDDPLVVGYIASDECEMGYSGCTPDWDNPNDEYDRLAIHEGYVNTFRSYNDGRFIQANFGNGVLRTFWAPNTMDEHVALVDASSVDKYMYTSPHVQEITPISPDWPDGVHPARSAAYGWLSDQMRRFQSPENLKPNWVFVETAMPFLTEVGATTIQPAQIEGAVWSAIIHEARGISYFQHNNNGQCGTYSLVECSQQLKDAVRAVNAKVKSLAPVINTQSYIYDFQASLDTMLKTKDGFAYIFAGVGLQDATGSKTFNLPTGPQGINGTTAEVVGENRTITVVDGKFTDNFPNEYTHHVYKISLLPD